MTPVNKKQKTSIAPSGSLKLLTSQWKLDASEEPASPKASSPKSPPTPTPTHDTAKLEQCLWTWSWMDDDKRRAKRPKPEKKTAVREGQFVFSIEDPREPKEYRKRTRSERNTSPKYVVAPVFQPQSQQQRAVAYEPPSQQAFPNWIPPSQRNAEHQQGIRSAPRDSVDSMMLNKLTTKFLQYGDPYVR